MFKVGPPVPENQPPESELQRCQRACAALADALSIEIEVCPPNSSGIHLICGMYREHQVFAHAYHTVGDDTRHPEERAWHVIEQILKSVSNYVRATRP